jgi:serine/threonine protein kinase
LILNLQPKHRAGDKLNGGWVLKQFLGMGSFGEVWVGRHDRYPEDRAFKFFTQPGAKDWFDREGTALFAVQKDLKDCPNVIKYLDVADADPHRYLVLEYVDGGSLEEWILAPAAERRSLDIGDVVEGIVRGLAAAHAYGICHRDLKPANVLLTGGPDAIPKIADFGLSRVESPLGVGSSAVSQAVTVGTRMYLPPEAADPYETRPPAQDDVFALGVIWYQLVTSRLERPPYDFADRLAAAGTYSRAVRLISRCLAHPDRRFRGAGELLAELNAESADASWAVPDGCLDVGPIAREYVERAVR